MRSVGVDFGGLAGHLGEGLGGGILGWVSAILHHRHSREANFQKRVDGELEALRQEVIDCRLRDKKREQHLLLISVGFRMIIPELQRFDRHSLVLKQVASALSALPPEDQTFDDLIEQLNQIGDIDESDPQPAPRR